MGLPTLLKQMYLQTVGGTVPAGALNASGDLSQMMKYVVSKSGGATKLEQFPAGSAAAFAAGTFTTKYTDLSTGVQADSKPNALDVHPDSNYVAMALATTSPYAGVWRFSSAGWGTRLSNPSTAFTNGQTFAVRFHPNGNWLFVGSSQSPYLACYAFDKVAGTIGARSADMASLTSQGPNTIDISPDGLTVLTTNSASPYVEAWAFNPTTGAWGSKYSNPATLPAGSGYQARFSPTGLQVVVTHLNTPYTTAYPWTNASGFGTKFADPVTVPTVAQSLDFAADSVWFACGGGAPQVFGYPWSASGFGTKFTDPTASAVGGGSIVANRLGTHVFVAGGTSPYLEGYAVTPSGWGTKLAAPASTPAANLFSLSCGANSLGEFMVGALANTSPYAYVAPFKFGGFYTPTYTLTSVGVTAVGNPLKVLYSANGKFAPKSINYEVGSYFVPVGADYVIFGSSLASAKGQVSGYG